MNAVVNGTDGRQERLVRRRVKHALQLLDRGDADEATEILMSLAKKHPQDAAIWVELAYVARVSGRDAVPYARRANDLVPEDPRAHRELAMALAEDPDTLVEALEVARLATQLDERDALNWALLGALWLVNGEVPVAIATCQRALVIDPACPEAHMVLGDAAASSRDWRDAEEHYHRVLRLTPDNEDARAALAVAHSHTRTNGHATPNIDSNGDGVSHPAAPAGSRERPSSATSASPEVDGAASGVLAAVERHVDAYNRRDLETLVDGFAHDAILRAAGQVIVGRDDLRRLFAATVEAPEDTTLELTNAVVQDGTAACELTERMNDGTHTYETHLVGFYTVRAGAIVHARLYREDVAD